MRNSRRRQRGAALLILLTLVGVGAASLLIGALGGRNPERSRERHTLVTLARATDALTGFAAANGRLPRPAVSALDGRESPLPCTSEARCTGFLPWVTLGIDGADSWGKLLRYSVTPAFTVPMLTRDSAVPSKVLLSRDSNGALRYVAGMPACLPASCVPLVVWSQGRNNFGTTVNGAALPNSASDNDDEAANDSADVRFISRAASAEPAQEGGPFDDLFAWVSQAALLGRMTAAHRFQ